ncbi:fructosamine kinase family protein [Actinomadura parmotrematis]|uniref:Fructosamine kinase family protein n=1 Tax=Actinomadura parmotrematis TaxID=2864039 RepID=A0ABS7G3G8_9ACTN|nr:fructosamine kinase family protein [Actinomadura parmotrematis]MBW8487265.1 fructosamine kinase family protein [Actinomadura parmotrematis]
MRDVRDLGSSHSWTLHQAVTGDGRQVFVKRARGAGDVFAAEAAGLRWLKEAGPRAPVADVLEVAGDHLVLPWLEETAPTREAAERFGRDLALLHLARPDRYGAPWPGKIADLDLDNTPDGGPWSRWYAERRLAPYLRRAAGTLGPGLTRRVERVLERIGDLAGPEEGPARIHGDLWSGNVMWTTGGAVLIDPAAHGGHRETDLAMLGLFGLPHLATVLAAYAETAPPAAGWRERTPLHLLHPLLVHTVLYGAAYAGRVDEAVRNLSG